MLNLQVTFRDLESTEALKAHVAKKVEKFEKYVTYPIEVRVILTSEKPYQRAEITVHAERQDLVAEERTKDLYEAIDLAVHKMENQLKKEREKRKGHSAAHTVNRQGAEKLGTDVAAAIPHMDKKSNAG